MPFDPLSDNKVGNSFTVTTSLKPVCFLLIFSLVSSYVLSYKLALFIRKEELG